MTDRVPIYSTVSGREKVVGAISWDDYARTWILEKRVIPEKHMYRITPGWAMDDVHIAKLRELAGEEEAIIRLHSDDGEYWITSLTVWDENAFKHRGIAKDQTLLELKHWSDAIFEGTCDGVQGTFKL